MDTTVEEIVGSRYTNNIKPWIQLSSGEFKYSKCSENDLNSLVLSIGSLPLQS